MRNRVRLLTDALRKWNETVFALVAVLGIVLWAPSGLAQSGAGSVQGTVLDPTGAVIPEASIHVVNLETNVATNTKSNNVGFYQVPDLFTGTYVISVTAPGFKTYQKTIELQVAQDAVINAPMTTGNVTQQVKVSADAAQLTTTDSGVIASTLESSRIDQLPMNGRLLTTLTGETTPGVESSGNGQRANGLMPEALEYVADGVTLSDRQFGGEKDVNAQIPDPDSVREVRVETTNTGAQYSEPATAIITTKSGTNSLHGSFFETARNNAIGVAKVRQNPSNFAAPHLVRNEFGASAGGPVILPHLYHGKDKTFWFFAYERYSLSQSQSELVSVPTDAMRKGDFSGLTTKAGVLQQLYDPMTTAPSQNCAGTPKNLNNSYCRTAFYNNQIPINRLAKTSKIIYDLIPEPSTADNPLVQPNLSATNPAFTVVPHFTFRIDHVFNDHNRAYVRFSNNNQNSTSLRNYPSNEPATVAADGFPAGASGFEVVPAATHNAAIGYSHVFSPSFFAETVVSQQWEDYYDNAGGSPTTDFEKMLGLPNNFGEAGFPYFSGGISPLSGTQFVYGMDQIVSTIDENLTKTIGRHQLLFGGRYRHERFAYRPDLVSDTISFSNLDTGIDDPSSGKNYSVLTNTGYAEGDLFLGAASNYTVNEESPYAHFHDMEFDAYIQDNFHVTRNLTFNIGIRYENHPAPWTKYGQALSFDLKNHALVFATSPAALIAKGLTTQALITNLQNDGAKLETAAEAGFPANTLLNNYPFTIGPRVGLAWQPFGGKYGTVIRGGYGRYIYPIPIRNSLLAMENNAPLRAGYSHSYTGANQSPDGLPNYLLRNPQPVIMGVNSENVVDSGTTTSLVPGIAIYSMDHTYPPDFVTQTNATIEQSFRGNSALRITWLWSHGTNLDQQYHYNLAPSSYVWQMETGTIAPTGGASTIGTNQYAATATNPYDKITWGDSRLDQKSGWSNDNALQVNYQRLYHNGSAYQIAYVWSKAFRVGGNTSRDGLIDPAADYVGSTQGAANTYMTPAYGPVIAPALPPPPPPNTASYGFYHALDVFENYSVDTAIPRHHIIFNGIVDLPFGRGKRFLGNANRFLNEVVGGVQIAGDGSINSQSFAVNDGNWGPTHPLKVYKHHAPITDCRSGVCRKAYLWFNGYIAPTAISGNACAGSLTAVVYGLPANYQPSQTPIDTQCSAPINGTTVTDKYFGKNEVNITLPGGTPTPITYSPGPQGSNPYSRTVLNGPMNYVADLSVFKTFPITEKTNLRLNADAFNVFNNQGYVNPDATDGTEQLTSSYNTGRQIQLTLRLTF